MLKVSPSNKKNKSTNAEINFHHVDYKAFRQLAKNNNLSLNEKSAFPDSYRKNKDILIFKDIMAKIPALKKRGLLFADIGCGCTPLAQVISAHCAAHKHRLLLADSPEMLKLAPSGNHIEKYAGEFPLTVDKMLRHHGATVAGIIAYSVIQYPFFAGTAFDFIDGALKLLTNQGVLLLADIPNRNSRKRFMSSPAGIDFHQKLTGKKDKPVIEKPLKWEITDSFIVQVISRYRKAGYNVYVLPQPTVLPFGNRREDIIIQKL